LTRRWSGSLLAPLAILQLTCNQVILTAPPGSTMTLFANPDFVPANGGTSVVTAVVVEPAGTPVPDGTVVQFFTTLGTIEEQGKTNDGVARVNFVADSRSGTATVSALSGGGTVPVPSPTASPTSLPSPVPIGAADARAATAALAVASLANSATVDITVGSALPTRMDLVAVPRAIRGQEQSRLTANVFDTRGNPVFNVPVIFTVSNNATHETLASRGRPVFTNQNGQAVDVLTTVYPPASPPRSIEVVATTANGVTATVAVGIN
jgi:hypothetical protein